MKFFRSKYLAIGALAGLLLGGGWFAWAAIQQEVGLNTYSNVGGFGSWKPACDFMSSPTVDGMTLSFAAGCTGMDVQTLSSVFNGTTYDRLRSVGVGDGAGTGIAASGLFGFNG